MTSQDFVASIEKYYGRYSTSFKREIVTEYIERIPVAERKPLLTVVLESISDQYKSVPDVAAIQKVRQENENEIARKAGKVWEDKLTGKYYIGDIYLGFYDDHRFIPNTMLQDRGALGYIYQPTRPEEYGSWLREKGLIEAGEKVPLKMLPEVRQGFAEGGERR